MVSRYWEWLTLRASKEMMMDLSHTTTKNWNLQTKMNLEEYFFTKVSRWKFNLANILFPSFEIPWGEKQVRLHFIQVYEKMLVLLFHDSFFFTHTVSLLILYITWRQTLFSLHYLLKAQFVEINGGWINEWTKK